MSKPSPVRRIFSGIWRGLTRVRLATSNILFLALIAFIYFVYIGGAPEPLPEKAALLLNISGTVVDQKSEINPLQALLAAPSPENHEVLLRDIIEAIDYAAADPSINSLVMELDSLERLGISKTQEIVDALQNFRESGKPMVAIGDYYTQDQYLLASHADTVIAHPLGGVALEGYSSYQNYFRAALKKISVNVHVFRAGDHKSAVEPFMRDDMSPAQKALTSRWLNELWGQYTTSVETQRTLKSGTVDNYIDNFAQRLKEQGGDAAQTALQSGLVDRLLTRSEGNDFLVELVGASDDDGLYEAVVFERYVARKRPMSLGTSDSDRVAVITAEGTIMPGQQPPGSIGGDSLAQLIRGAVEADGVKAIVLRVNSGGGSMFASEIIREQVVYARNMGLPVVVSMGAVAASGGYYIAADADEIWATPSTITGSIGVFAAFPTFEELLQRLGISTDGVGTTDLAGSMRADRPLNPQLVDALNSGVQFAYKSFVGIVAQGRDMSVAEVDPLAEGRVWSAADALKTGLVDNLGSLQDAIAAAAAIADLESYEVQYVERPLSPRDMVLKQLANSVGSLNVFTRSATSAALSGLLGPMQEVAKELGSMQDPGHLYMRCVTCSMAH
ncbi:MAG: signal peptide peptidase SppA [Halioglobus sp.]|jgi:protease-4|nr:signal peptide peptidase SppA [Halioglobus sp.]